MKRDSHSKFVLALAFLAMQSAHAAPAAPAKPATPAAPAAAAAKPAATATATSAAGATGTAASAPEMTPEALGAQAFLEELLVRRYSQELATRVERQAFSLGAHLELFELPKPKDPNPEDEIPEDLTVGMLDPDRMIRDYADTDMGLRYQGLLRNYRVRAVTFSVGLREDLGAEAKTQVEEWLKTRLDSEFKGAAKGSAYFIKGPIPKAVPHKTPTDWLETFQDLAGQAVLAFAIILGALFYARAARSAAAAAGASKEASSGAGAGAGANNANVHQSGSSKVEGEQHGDQKITQDESERAAAAKEIRTLSRQLGELVPRLGDEYEGVVRSWCKGGDEGKVKLACFAEAVGKDIGKLPIPADAVADVAKIFAKMPEVGNIEKRDALKKSYWDLLLTLNLGTDALEQPFNYLGGLRLPMVSQMLLDQNPRMRALVAFHMPVNLRDSYLRAMDGESKIAMIRAAGEMKEMPVDEFRSVDSLFKSRAQGTVSADVVPLSTALPKLLSALSPIEELTMLPDMTGGAFDELRRTVPSLAFLGEWPDDKLQALLARALPDEVVVLARVRADLKDRLLKLCPPMTAEVATEELAGKDSLKNEEKNRILASLAKRAADMVARREIDLEEIFAAQAPAPAEAGGEGASVTSIAPEVGASDDDQKAA